MNKARTRCVELARTLNIGGRIRATREGLGLSVEAAAKRLDVSPDFLSFLERSRPDYLSDKMLDKLVKKIGVPRTHLKQRQGRHNRLASQYHKAYRKKAA